MTVAALVTACLPPPPRDVLREEREATRRLVSRSFPQLLDLVDDGTLLALERSPRYLERRADGFQEPLLLLLLGTSHISTLSALNVHRVVKAVRPQKVVVELCRSRTGLMNETPSGPSTNGRQSNLMSMTGKSFSAALGRSLEIGGQSAMTLRFLLALVSEKLSSVAGVASGEEFRAARRASEEVGAQIVLGDRPIEITLRRSWEALDWRNRLKLTAFLLRGINSSKLDLSEESLQALRSDDALSMMFSYISKEFPTLLEPLIHDRDKYLAWSMMRSKAVNGSLRVVGVIGQGHMRGVVHVLKHEQGELRFQDLAGIRSATTKQDARRQARQILERLVVDTVLGVAIWLAYDYWCTNTDNSFFTNLFLQTMAM
eukprot:c13986_g1_i1 orf=389-1507(-)